jgi:hypothetical protein
VVAFGERADAEIDARQVESFTRAQFSSCNHPAGNVVFPYRDNFELYDPVIEEEILEAEIIEDNRQLLADLERELAMPPVPEIYGGRWPPVESP